MDSRENLFKTIDAVVILSWSNWFTEMRSNRYHYATRFAKHVPVLFVQPDLGEETYELIPTEIPNVQVLRIYQNYNETQQELFSKALLQCSVTRPLMWVYNGFFSHLLDSQFAELVVYHGTEDYFSPSSQISRSAHITSSLNQTLRRCDLVIAVSDGVKDSFLSYSGCRAPVKTVTNGCDYAFFEPKNMAPVLDLENPIVLYQGNALGKLDVDLMHNLALRLKNWQFHFCGTTLDDASWDAMCELPNVKYLGLLKPEELREEMYRSSVGIIPFIESEWLVARSFPLKAFEYLASGLPVVTIPIDALSPFEEVLFFASGIDAFESALKEAVKTRTNPQLMQKRLLYAKDQDYDRKFETVETHLDEVFRNECKRLDLLNIAVLYEAASTKVSTIQKHLSSFSEYSSHKISYIPATKGLQCHTNFNDLFDVLVIHYSIRVSVMDGPYMLSPSYIDAVRGFGGYKVLFIQDEYDTTNIAKHWIKQLGIHTVYTCVPEDAIDIVYPKSEFQNVGFVHNLTGYVSESNISDFNKVQTTKRDTFIAYRGRELPFWYGSLGQEKLRIGIEVKKRCLEKKLPVDIEWEASKRIYGDAWYTFLASSKATLGTESGSKLFDFDGLVRQSIEQAQQENPELTYEDLYESHIAPFETIEMNQISPKIFEAIALKTALILFEGSYSEVLIPHEHYIPLKKDFSNFDTVLLSLENDELIETMVNRAYQDIILSNKYSYRNFISNFDKHISQHAKRKKAPLVDYISLPEIEKKGLYSRNTLLNLLSQPSSKLYYLTELPAPAPKSKLKFKLVPEPEPEPEPELESKQEIQIEHNVLKMKSYVMLQRMFVKYGASFFFKSVRLLIPRPVKEAARRILPDKVKHKFAPIIHRYT